MDSKAFFLSILKAHEELRLLQDEKERYAELATSLGSMGQGLVRSSEKHSRVESAAIRLAEITEKLDAQANQYIDLLDYGRRIITAIPNDKQRQVMTYRYICGYGWKYIQEKMKYNDIKSVYRLHGWALQAADALLKKID